MKFGVSWRAKGIKAEARETAKEAARRAGVSVDDWMNSAILQQAAQGGVNSPGGEHSSGEAITGVHQRLDDLSRRVDHFTGSGVAAYAPRHVRAPAAPIMAPPPRPPELDRALAEIAARQHSLNSDPVPVRPIPKPLAPAAPAPTQNFAALQAQLRKITDQIETLRTPGVEQAIHALREELAEIGRTLNEAMPRRELEAIERQIQDLSRRVAEGRQAGVDAGALAGIEHGLAEVRDALRGLTPAENLVGYTEAVANLSQKIDLIVADKDPATMRQLEGAITTLRGLVSHVASNETVSRLAAEVQALAEKIDNIGHAGPAGDALASLERRIDALNHAIAERSHDGGAVSPRLEALMASLADKIDSIPVSGTDHVAVSHLEDRIVALVERLDASGSRLGHLESIERGLAELLVHIEDTRGARPSSTTEGFAVEALREDFARTHDALEAMHGTLGLVVDRLAGIEHDIRGDHPAPAPAEEEPLELFNVVDAPSMRTIEDAPALAPAPQAIQPPPLPAAAVPPPAMPPPSRLPRASNLTAEADEPLEPGSGPPPVRANPAARIAASEAALGSALPAAPATGHSSFIAAARRAAQAASQQPDIRRTVAPAIAANNPNSLRGKMMKRMKSLFIAASIVALVVGSIQIAGTILGPGGLTRLVQRTSHQFTNTKVATDVAPEPAEEKTEAEPLPLAPPVKLAEKKIEPAQDSGLGLLSPPAVGTDFIKLPPAVIAQPRPGAPPVAVAMPDPRQALNAPPAINPSTDITGSIPEPKAAPAPKAPQPPVAGNALPAAIGGARLRTAAVAGDAAAAYEVGLRYAEGRGVPANPEEAARWFERAAIKGLAPAQFRYASQLEKGIGVKKDLMAARRLYLAAAAQGNAKAMHNLAVLYAEGLEGKPEYETSAKWFLKAAQHGVADSQYNLGVLYARGIGVTANLAESYKWFALAAAGGDPEAGKKRDELAAHMDAATLAAARRAVETFKAEPQPAAATTVAEPPGGWDKAAAPGKPPRTAATFTIGKR